MSSPIANNKAYENCVDMQKQALCVKDGLQNECCFENCHLKIAFLASNFKK